MTMRSLSILGVCALAGAVAAAMSRARDVRARAARESSRCERLLRGLDARCAAFR